MLFSGGWRVQEEVWLGLGLHRQEGVSGKTPVTTTMNSLPPFLVGSSHGLPSFYSTCPRTLFFTFLPQPGPPDCEPQEAGPHLSCSSVVS